MAPPRFDNVLSMGNLIQIGAFAVMIGLAWGNADNRLTMVEDAQKTIIETSNHREIRVRTIEIAASRSDEQIRSLLQSMNELKQAQRETNELLRRLSETR